MFDRVREIWHRMTRGSDRATGTPDRRHVARDAADIPIVCRAAQVNVPPTPVRARDLSRTGVSFIFDVPVDPGTVVTLDLPTADGCGMSVLACVRHRTAHGNGSWVIGCVFAAELGDGDLAGFGVARAAAADRDKRRWARVVPTKCSALVRPVADPSVGPAAADVLNLSPMGVGLLVRTQTDAGVLLDLELIGRPEQSGLTMMAGVVYSAPRGDGSWVLGCTFIRELTDAEVRAIV